jgi:hypothetical protein
MFGRLQTHSLIILIGVFCLNLSLKCWNGRPSESTTASYHISSNLSFTIIMHCKSTHLIHVVSDFISKVRLGYGIAQQAATVTSYAMEKRAIRKWFAAQAKFFLFSSVHTGSGAQPTSYSVGTEGSLTSYEATET